MRGGRGSRVGWEGSSVEWEGSSVDGRAVVWGGRGSSAE